MNVDTGDSVDERFRIHSKGIKELKTFNSAVEKQAKMSTDKMAKYRTEIQQVSCRSPCVLCKFPALSMVSTSSSDGTIAPFKLEGMLSKKAGFCVCRW